MGEFQGKVYGSAKTGSSNAETDHALGARAMAWWRDAIVACTAPLSIGREPYNILVVSHGGFISTLVKNLIRSSKVTSDAVKILPSLPNVSVSVIEWDGEIWRLVKYGDISHLKIGPLDHSADEMRF